MNLPAHRAILFLSLAAMCGPAAGQTPSRSAIGLISGMHSSSYDNTSFFGGNNFTHEFTGEEGYSFGEAGASGNGVSGGSAFAQIGFGWMRLVGTVTSVSGANPEGHSNGGESEITFTGRIADELTIQSPTQTGQAGTVKLSALLGGVLSPSVESSAGAGDQAGGTATASMGAGFIVSTGANTFPGDVPIRVDDVDIGGDVGFIYGTPFAINMEVNVRGRVASASNGLFSASAVSVGDFSRTLAWGGISNVRDAGGNPVTDYTVTSLSGTDYRGPIVPPPLIPEPATLQLCLALLAASGVVRWRRCCV